MLYPLSYEALPAAPARPGPRSCPAVHVRSWPRPGLASGSAAGSIFAWSSAPARAAAIRSALAGGDAAGLASKGASRRCGCRLAECRAGRSRSGSRASGDQRIQVVVDGDVLTGQWVGVSCGEPQQRTDRAAHRGEAAGGPLRVRPGPDTVHPWVIFEALSLAALPIGRFSARWACHRDLARSGLTRVHPGPDRAPTCRPIHASVHQPHRRCRDPGALFAVSRTHE